MKTCPTCSAPAVKPDGEFLNWDAFDGEIIHQDGDTVVLKLSHMDACTLSDLLASVSILHEEPALSLRESLCAAIDAFERCRPSPKKGGR